MDFNNGICIQYGFLRSAPANIWNNVTLAISHNIRALVCSCLDANAGIAVARNSQTNISLYTTISTNLEWILIG